jgi:hypothetical protein
MSRSICKIKLKIILTICGVMLLALTIASVSYDARPSRKDCIVGFTLDWSSVKSNRLVVRNSLFDNHLVGLAALSIPDDASLLYLQFRHDCARKAQMAERLIEAKPSPQTIDQRNPTFWRD